MEFINRKKELTFLERLVGTDVYETLKEKAKLVEWGRKERKEYSCLFRDKFH